MPQLKVMTWNVENLFDPSENTRLSAAELVEKQATFQSKLSLLNEVVQQQDYDIIGLQEVGSLSALTALQTRLGNYPHLAISDYPDGRGIRNAFLSKHPITKKQNLVHFPAGVGLLIFSLDGFGNTRPVTRMGRGALYISFEKAGRTFHAVVAHLKSKLLTYPRASGFSAFSPRNEFERTNAAAIALHRRTAEAATLRLKVNQLLQENDARPLILMGDFNDVPNAQTSLILNGPSGSTIGTRGFDTPDKGDDTRLFNLATLFPAERNYSRIHKGVGELLDQILVSEELLPRDPATNKRQLPEVDSLVDFAGNLASIGSNPNARADKVAPDHAPVVARFEW